MTQQQITSEKDAAQTMVEAAADPGSLPRIDRKYVHKYQARNVLLSRVDRVEGRENCFEATLTPDWTHPAYFEHPCDHVPSMMFIEAGRQMVIALSHLHLDVPIGMAFVVSSLQIHFEDFADIHSEEPVILRADVSDMVRSNGQLYSMKVDGTFHQGSRDVGGMSGVVKLFPREVYERLRRRRMKKD